jgi:hypothetical protein
MTFAIACFLAYFWATYVVPETANVSLEEIDAVFKSSAGVEDAALKRQVSTTLFTVPPFCSIHMTDVLSVDRGRAGITGFSTRAGLWDGEYLLMYVML